MSKTLIIFDIDGTLLHSNRVDSHCFALAYKDVFGIDFPSIDWNYFPHVTDTSIFDTAIKEHFNRPATDSDKETMLDRFIALLEENRRDRPERFMEVPGAKSLVDRLIADDRFTLGIGTGGWARPAKLKLKHVNIQTDPLYMSFADDNWTREAIIRGVYTQLAEAKESYERVVYVGDAIWDVNTTRNMGIDFIGVRLNGDFEKLAEQGAATVLQHYLDQDQFMEAVVQATVPKNIK